MALVRMLEESCIDNDVAEARGYRWVTDAAELTALGFNEKQRKLVPGLLVPSHAVDGVGVVGHQFRPTKPRTNEDGKPIKYEAPAGSRTHLDCNPLALPALFEPSVSLWITEGVKKADAAVSAGLCCVALAGVWNWKRDGRPLPDWEHIALEGREVNIAYDSDVMTKSSVQQALNGLTTFLALRGAVVRWVVLPQGDEDLFGTGSKVGLDDYFAAGHTVEDLRSLVAVPRLAVLATGDTYEQMQVALAGLHVQNDPPRLFRRADAILEAPEVGDVVEMDDRRLALISARDLSWVKYLKDVVVPARPDKAILSNLSAAWDEWPFPILDRVVTTPTFASDGSLRTEPGYHAASRTLYRPDEPLSIRPVPPRPSPADMRNALALIADQLLGEFDFRDDADRAHAIALVLQPFARDLIRGNTPLFVVEAPKQGTGKTLLADSALAVGHGVVGSLAEPHGDEELEKRITTAMIRAQPVFFIDNVTRKINWSSLATALTKRMWEGRVLGESRGVRVAITCTWVLTANNPQFSDDLIRRVVSIRLDAKLERPQDRTGFKRSLPDWAYRNRAELIWAACTLIQSWIVAGRPAPPNGAPTLGGFGPWRRVIGGIMHHVGVPGFLGNLGRLHATNDDAESFAYLAHRIVAKFGEDKPFTARDVSEIVFHEPELAVVVDPANRVRDYSYGQAVGMFLTAHLDQVVDGFRLERCEKQVRSGAKVYRFVRVGGGK